MPPSNGRGSLGRPPPIREVVGAPGCPATVVDHDLRPGGRITFFTVGPEGERHNSTWEVIAADPPRHLELRDGDVDDDGRPNDGNAMTAMIITIDQRDRRGAVMAIRTHFDSQAGMEHVLATGIEEGMRIVCSQIDAVLAGTSTCRADTVAGREPGHHCGCRARTTRCLDRRAPLQRRRRPRPPSPSATTRRPRKFAHMGLPIFV